MQRFSIRMEQLAKSKARPGVACFSGVRPPRDTLSALKKLFENNLTLRLPHPTLSCRYQANVFAGTFGSRPSSRPDDAVKSTRIGLLAHFYRADLFFHINHVQSKFWGLIQGHIDDTDSIV